MYQFSEKFVKFGKSLELNQKLNNIVGITNIISNKNFNLEELNNYLKENSIQRIEDIKFDTLELLVSYAHYILEDNIISNEELDDFSFLKLLFKIKEGDFIKYKNGEISEILKKQFIRMYSDQNIDSDEKIQKVNLQSLFDLSYDEFENLKKEEVINSLLNGANPKDLDITKIPKGFNF